MTNEGRGGGRKARAGRASGGIAQLPWRNVVNGYQPLEILNDEQLGTLHRTSMRILSELGIKVMSEKAMDLFEKAGAIAYIKADYALPGTKISVAILGRSHAATVLGEPPYDPAGARLRG